jgi:methionine-rich copper-binding protein CopC
METTLNRPLSLLPVALAALLLAPIPALAHAELAATIPEAGAELEAPPDEVVLVFEGELDAEASTFTVTDGDGTEVGRGEVDLQVAERNELRGPVTIDAPGEYTVAWSIVAADGHPDEGAFTFTVAPADEAGGSTPDTALASPRGVSPLVLVGLALVLVAARMSRRRLTADLPRGR